MVRGILCHVVLSGQKHQTDRHMETNWLSEQIMQHKQNIHHAHHHWNETSPFCARFCVISSWYWKELHHSLSTGQGVTASIWKRLDLD